MSTFDRFVKDIVDQSDFSFCLSRILFEDSGCLRPNNDLLLSSPCTRRGGLLCHDPHGGTIVGNYILGPLLIDYDGIINADLLGIRVEADGAVSMSVNRDGV